jgi:hypothetical protein
VACQFEEKRHIPFVATDHEKRHGRDTIWTLRAKEAPDHIKENWPGSAWIVEVIAYTTTRRGKRGSGSTCSSPALEQRQKHCCG